MLTPADIENVSFDTTRLKEGYDQDSVDNFLDRAGEALSRMTDANNQAQEELVRTRRQLAEAKARIETLSAVETQVIRPAVPEFLGDVSRILSVAQQTADEQVAEARSEASRLTYDARVKAQALLDSATKDADTARIAAQDELSKVQLSLQELTDRRQRTRSFLADQLSALNAQLEGV